MNNKVVKKLMVAGLVSAAMFAQAAKDFSFDLRVPGRTLLLSTSSYASAVDGVVRRSSLAAGVTRAPALSVGDRLSFRLFDDVVVTLVLKERTESPLGGESFLARSVDNATLTAVVLQTVDGITAEVSDIASGRVYSIVSTAEGVAVRELDAKAGIRDNSRTVVPEIPQGARLLSAAPASDQASTLVDVLVAYDRGAAAWAKLNEGGITNFATMAVQKMNTVIANTGFASTFRFRLVGAMTVDADGGSDFDGVLSSAQAGSGAWAPVKSMRDQVGADMVTVMIDTGRADGTTGLGYSLSKGTSADSFSEHPYNVCAIRSVAQSHTMTHETGHNLGAGHSDYQTKQPGPQLYDYSAGHYFTAGGTYYHTIMAYDDDGHGGLATEVPYFSSPDYTYLDVAVGDADHDNVRTIQNTYQAAANWRKQVVPMSYDVYFSPEGGSTFTDSISVELTPGKAGLPIRYTLDGSMPTIGSTLYTDPIVLTSTTTIRAVAIVDGMPGPVFEATYSASDIGAGVDAPQLVWRTSEVYPWIFQTAETYDGVDALQSAEMPIDGYQHDSWVETDVTGPTIMSFAFRREYMYYSEFSVSCDGTEVFAFDEDGTPNDWQVVEIEIPSGKHKVRFNFHQWGCYSDVFNGIYLDQVRFDALSRPPTMSPATTDDEETAYVFHGSMQVTLTPPDGREGALFYTIDGSDPMGVDGKEYSGPITLTKSTLVRAVFVEGGKDASVEARGVYLERHPVKPGEWTTDVEGVKIAAAKDGRLICVMRGNYGGCGITQSFYDDVVCTEEFLSWAEANGIYLVRADSSVDFDSGAAKSWFGTLMSDYGDSDSYYYTRTYFALPSDPMKAISRGGAGPDCCKFGTVAYDYTVASVIAGFASVLGEAVPEAPTCSQTGLVAAFPVQVELANPNGYGTIYYTLDGSYPSKANGTKYTGPITVASANIRPRAMVWPDSGCSSTVTEFEFYSIASVLGTTGIEWTTGNDYGWDRDNSAERTVKTPFVSSVSRTSWLQGTVIGKGKLVFTLTACSYSWQNEIRFLSGGTEVFSHAYNGTTTRTVTITQEVASATAFRWEYEVLGPANDYSVCGARLSNVQWIPEAKPDPLPELDKPTAESIKAVLEKAKDAKLAAEITNADEYAAFREWAGKVKGAGGVTAGCDVVMASGYAWQSFALALGTLLKAAIDDNDLTVEEFKPTGVVGKFDFTVSVEGVEVGSEASKVNLKKVFGLEGTSELRSGFSANEVDIAFGTPMDGKLKFTAGPKDATQKTFFMKMKVK